MSNNSKKALIAAFSYPIGNQLVWQVSYNARKRSAEPTSTQKIDIQANEISKKTTSLITEAPALSADMTYTADAVDSLNLNHPTQTLPSSVLQTLIARIPAIKTTLLQNAFNKVWLMTANPAIAKVGVVYFLDQVDIAKVRANVFDEFVVLQTSLDT